MGKYRDTMEDTKNIKDTAKLYLLNLYINSEKELPVKPPTQISKGAKLAIANHIQTGLNHTNNTVITGSSEPNWVKTSAN